MFSLICVRINCWINNRKAGDLRRHRGHYDVSVMTSFKLIWRVKIQSQSFLLWPVAYSVPPCIYHILSGSVFTISIKRWKQYFLGARNFAILWDDHTFNYIFLMVNKAVQMILSIVIFIVIYVSSLDTNLCWKEGKRDVIRCYGTGSTLVQLLLCFLTRRSKYVN